MASVAQASKTTRHVGAAAEMSPLIEGAWMFHTADQGERLPEDERGAVQYVLRDSSASLQGAEPYIDRYGVERRAVGAVRNIGQRRQRTKIC